APSAGPDAKPKDQAGPNAANILVGGQDQFVAVKSSNVNYDGGTGAFTFDVTVRNLIPQPMGTKDTTGAQAPDANGVRVFFAAGPTVTSGTGIITVSGDGVGTFTGVNQPYYQYNTVLDPFEISAPKTWQLNMPPTVTTFDFLLLVSTEVPRPDGYIDVQVSQLRPPQDKQATYTVRNALGTIDNSGDPINWSVSDTTRATVDANGLINPLRAGNVTIIAQQGLRIGKITVAVKSIRRLWTGATGTTNYATGANWMPDSIKPEPTDTAVVNDAAATIFPLLTQNESIGGVEVLDITPGGTIPTLSIGPFNLTASGDVATTSSGNINGSAGSLILTGVARTMKGLLPRINVLGSYTLDGNVTAQQRIQVQGGRITNWSFRLQQNPF
ncbi:MAG TPA: Ig-like domain-containing protein, partial [Gemmatimonadaceae bacterium]|nr:Ig-like domain-containing protein [Gemmatimonadaceae bacterium]